MGQKKFIGLKDDYTAEREQADLRTKYGIKRETVRVVVVTNPLVQALRVVLAALGKVALWAARVMLVLLACVGTATLVYPALRTPFFVLMQDTWRQLLNYL